MTIEIRRPGRVLGACAVFLAFSIVSAIAEPRAACTSDAMIVFDASRSMLASDFPDGAPSRIDRVRNALKRMLPRVSKARNLGLIVYGPGKYDDACRNVSLRFRPMPDAGSRIMSEVERLRPDGRTPLTVGVREAANVLGGEQKPATIVLLTDGEETCGGDPCALARQIHTVRPEITVHVIGYKLQSLDGRPAVSGAKCLADATGGIYASVETVDELSNALSQSLACPTVAEHGTPRSTRIQ